MKITFPIATFAMLGVAVAATSGCGNGWLTSSEREKSPSALMLKAQLLYDKGKFAEAAAAYQEIIDQNPQNERARVRLAYALNGEAGLGPLALLTKLSKIQSTPTPKASGASAATTSTSKNSLTQLTSAAGLTAAEIAAVAKANPKTFQDLLNAETKFASLASSDPTTFAQLSTAAARFRKLQASWKAICQLVPKSILDAVVNSAARKKALELESCLGGLNAAYQKPAILFSAAISTLAQGAALYQVKLDTNNDGTVDAIKTADTLTKEISALNTASSSATDPTEIKKSIDTLNTKIAALNTIGETLTHELVDLALAQFEIMSLLMTAIEDVVPENVGKSLINGVKKFEESKTKITGYVNTNSVSSTGKKTSAKQDKIAASASSAAKAADAYYDKFKTENTDPSKLEEFKDSFATTCSQFDTLKATFGSKTATKPSNCANVTLAFGLDSNEAHVAHEAPLVADAEASVDDVFALENGDTGEYEDVEREFLDFLRFGDTLLRAD